MQKFTRRIVLIGAIPLVILACVLIYSVSYLIYNMGISWGVGWSFVMIFTIFSSLLMFLVPALVIWVILIFLARKSDRSSEEYDLETKAWHDRLDLEDKVNDVVLSNVNEGDS